MPKVKCCNVEITEENGYKAIMALQGMANIKETEASARRGWKLLTPQEQETTIAAWMIFFPNHDGKEKTKAKTRRS